MNATAVQILEAFSDLVAQSFGAQLGVTPVVASDPGRAIDLLTAGQMGALAVVCYYDSDQPAGEDAWDPRTSATLKAVVYRRTGMDAGGPGSRALELAGALRRAVCGAQITGSLGGIEYRGMVPVATAEGRLLNGYSLSFGVLYAAETD